MFDRFSHCMMYVNDLDRAVKFYTDILGFTPNFIAPKFYASLRHDGMKCRIDLHPTEMHSKDVGAGPIPNFETKNFDNVIAELKQKGVKIGAPRREGDSPRFVTFWDSEGNAIGFSEMRG